MKMFKDIFREIDLDLFMYPYKVVATAPGCGVIEVVPDVKSCGELGKESGADFFEYFVKTHGEDMDTSEFQKARLSFVKSMAPYSVFCQLLQIKDRHNANLMLDRAGHIIHIDFGFMLEASPGGDMKFEPDFKLTAGMLAIMGANNTSPTVDTPAFRMYCELCIRAFLAVRQYQEQIVSAVALTADSNLPCFRGMPEKALDGLKNRFLIGKSAAEAAVWFKRIIDNCSGSWRTFGYDVLQEYQNKIYRM